MAKGKIKTRKRLIIVHGWEGYPEEGWFPWLKAEMEKEDWSAVVPALPNAARPQLVEWLPTLKEVVGKANTETFLVGHSLGCVTINRFLESLDGKEKIGGAVEVAPFDNPLKYRELENFFESPPDWEKIKKSCEKIVFINSEDDPFVPIDNGIRLQQKLGGKLIKTTGWRHFSGEDGITSVPLVKEQLLKMSPSK